jgi:hypothetical protein
MLAYLPELRGTTARKDLPIIGTAKHFQAAYDTLSSFDPCKPRDQGISSFQRHLARIDDPDDLWIILAGLKTLTAKSPFD